MPGIFVNTVYGACVDSQLDLAQCRRGLLKSFSGFEPPLMHHSNLANGLKAPKHASPKYRLGKDFRLLGFVPEEAEHITKAI